MKLNLHGFGIRASVVTPEFSFLFQKNTKLKRQYYFFDIQNQLNFAVKQAIL